MDRHLEEKVREIIKDEYGFGDQNIESEDIYNKLIQIGETVPDFALDEIFHHLKNQGLIKGPFRMNSEAVRKHGAIPIMWVSRYI